MITRCAIQFPNFQVAKLPSCQVVKLPTCQLAKLPTCQVAKFPSCQVSKLPSCQVAKLPNCQDAKMPSCQVAKLLSCQVAKLPSSQGPKFQLSINHQSSIIHQSSSEQPTDGPTDTNYDHNNRQQTDRHSCRGLPFGDGLIIRTVYMTQKFFTFIGSSLRDHYIGK